MKTICVKCGWHANQPCRTRLPHICYAPWPMKIDVVTGKRKPEFLECDRTNSGDCVHFKPKWYVCAWNYICKHFPFPTG